MRITGILSVALVCLTAVACAGSVTESSGSSGGDGGAPSTGTADPGGGSGGGTSTSTSTSTSAAECASDTDCDDGNPCTLDYCTPTGCYNPEDTMMSLCNEGSGHCYKSECCTGCIDVKTMACVQECPNSAACTSQGTCS